MSAAGRLSLRDRLLVWAAGTVAPAFLRLLGSTWKVRVEREDLVRAARSGDGVILAFWHGQLLPLEYVYRARSICVLSSWHRDGEMSARLMSALGYTVVRGSTSRGSVRGLLAMLAKSSEGLDLAVTPDGPRGPAGSVKPGVFFLSDRAGAPIVPMAAWARPASRLSSWDGFIVPLPFSRVGIVYGEPMLPGDPSSLDARAEELKLRLDALTRQARRLVGAG